MSEQTRPETFLEYCVSQSIQAARDEKYNLNRQREERFLPEPTVVSCSECGGQFVRYLRTTTYAHCCDHTPTTEIE